MQMKYKKRGENFSFGWHTKNGMKILVLHIKISSSTKIDVRKIIFVLNLKTRS